MGLQPAPWRCLSLLVSAPTFVPASTLRIAVLVDGENAESALLQSALEEAGRSDTTIEDLPTIDLRALLPVHKPLQK